LELAEHTVIFPNPVQILAQGKKAATCMFMRLASFSLGYQQPIIAVREPPTWPEVQAVQKGTNLTVLKRECSDASAHVIAKGGKLTKREFEKVIAGAKIWEKLPFGIPKWLEQPYVPELKFMGEVRTLVVNGLITYTLLTTSQSDNTWRVTVIRKVRPLEILR
jgi:hypothetical protein